MIKSLVLSLLLITALISTQTTFADIGLTAQPEGRGLKVSGNAGPDLENFISNTISLFFTIGGIGFIIMILWGAVDWILSGGDKEKIAGARKRITTAILGIVILSLAFVIALVLGQILGLNALMSGNFSFKSLLAP